MTQLRQNSSECAFAKVENLLQKPSKIGKVINSETLSELGISAYWNMFYITYKLTS